MLQARFWSVAARGFGQKRESMRKGQDAPWNPSTPARVSPTEYEQQVVAWLKRSGRGLENFRVEHLVHWEGAGGDYEFDAVADFTIFSGASIKMLAECKRYSRPVE